jgi:hypothetical protein
VCSESDGEDGRGDTNEAPRTEDEAPTADQDAEAEATQQRARAENATCGESDGEENTKTDVQAHSGA